MASEALKKIADELKNAREEKDISLQQIASKTKIDIKFLRAIENANFEILPDLYMKAFIREFAQYIDLDPNAIIQKFENAKQGKPEEATVTETVAESSPETMTEEKAGKKFDSIETAPLPASEDVKTKKLNTNYVYVGTIAVLILILVYILFIKGSSPDIVQESFSQQTANQDKPRYEMTEQNNNPSQVNSSQSNSNMSDSLRLSVQTLNRVWVKVASDGKIITQQVYQPDSKLHFAASKNFSVTVGNAGMVKLLLNNKPIQNIGKTGEIRNLYITPDTIRYYTIIPPTKNETKSAKKN
ncbi:MAG: RodZ domain-containing protein [Bacteroidota bacterium]